MKRFRRFLMGSLVAVLLAGALGLTAGCDDHHRHRRIRPHGAYYVAPFQHRDVRMTYHRPRVAPPPAFSHRGGPPWDRRH